MKSALYSLGDLKKELCVFLNNYVNTFNPKDYGIRVYLFSGFEFYHKQTKEILASSPDMTTKYLESIKSQFADYRKVVEKIAGAHEWKSLDDRHDWFELFNSGEPQIIVMAT